MSTITNDMSLVVPESGDSSYATSISTSFTLIDDHDHSSGKGVQIPAGGLASNAVTTVKILDGAVTQAKRAALGHQLSSSCGSFSTSSTTLTDVTNLTVSITTTGRPVFLGLIAADTTNLSFIEIAGNADTGGLSAVSLLADVAFDRGGSTISTYALYEVSVPAANTAISLKIPPSSVYFIDVPAAGTYTYKVQTKMSATASATSELVRFAHIKLIAYEL